MRRPLVLSILLIVVVLLVLLALRSCSTSSLAGDWIGSGYTCNGATDDQSIRITQSGATVRATKMTGDDCIPSGMITWEGEYTGTEFPASMYVSHAGAEPYTIPVTITVKHPGELRLTSGSLPELVFTRVE